MTDGPLPHNPETTPARVTDNATVNELARHVQRFVIDLVGPTVPLRFDIADAVVSDALGLPGKDEYAFRLEKGLKALDAVELAALRPRVEGMLALAQAYAAHRPS